MLANCKLQDNFCSMAYCNNIQQANALRSPVSLAFFPIGAITVVDSMECLNWLEEVLNRLWIPGNPTLDTTHPPCRGMPLVILVMDGIGY